jgi:signal recognition particle subunit SRP54
MFDSLSSKFESILNKVRGRGRLTEDDVDEVLAEIRAALLDADVNVTVARNVVARIRAQSFRGPSTRASRSSRSSTRI